MENKCPIGIWKFTDRAIRNMKRLMSKTKVTGLEYGAVLEGDIIENNERIGILELGTECLGSECDIKNMRKASPDKYFGGEFHTHPNTEDITPSKSDLLRFDTLRLDILGNVMCIGNKEYKIKCFTHTYEALEPERIKTRKKLLEKMNKNNGLIRIKHFGNTKDIIKKDYTVFSPNDCKLSKKVARKIEDKLYVKMR